MLGVKVLWLGQNNYILYPVCVSSIAELIQPCQSHNVTILYNANWTEEEVCSSYLPRDPWYQWYDVIAEAQRTNTMLQENIHSDLGSKCQGYSVALAINKLMGWLTTYGGWSFVVVLFKSLFLEWGGKLWGPCSCLLCEGPWQLRYIPYGGWGSSMCIQN